MIIFVNSKAGTLLLAEAINKVSPSITHTHTHTLYCFTFFLLALAMSPLGYCWYPWRHGPGEAESDFGRVSGGKIFRCRGNWGTGSGSGPQKRSTSNSTSIL